MPRLFLGIIKLLYKAKSEMKVNFNLISIYFFISRNILNVYENIRKPFKLFMKLLCIHRKLLNEPIK